MNHIKETLQKKKIKTSCNCSRCGGVEQVIIYDDKDYRAYRYRCTVCGLVGFLKHLRSEMMSYPQETLDK